MKLKVKIEIEYEADTDNYPSDDPKEMALIDLRNFQDDHSILEYLMGETDDISLEVTPVEET